MRIRRPWRVLATAMLVALSLLAAGCADPVEDNPKKAFVDAVRELGDQPGATVTARIVADADNIVAVAASDGETIDVADVERVLNSAVAVSWHEGGDADDPDDDQGEFVLTIDGSDALEVRQDGEDVYLRADVQGLLGLSEDGPSEEDAALLLEELEAGGFHFARPAYEGRWLRLVGVEQAQSFFEGLVEGGGEGGGEAAATEQAERFTEAMGSAFRDLLRDDVEVRHVGADSVGDKVVASVHLGAFTDAFVEVLETEDLGMQSWGLDLAMLRADLDAVMSADDIIEVEAWIAGGLLRQVRLDLVGLVRQFDEHGDVPAELEPVHLELEFAGFREGVSAPDDSVEVDLFKVMGQTLGGLGSGFGGMYGDEDDWEPVEDTSDWDALPDEDGGELPEGRSDRVEPGTAPPDWEEPEFVDPELDEPDWEEMTDEEFDEWMRDFERQLEKESAAN